MWIFFFIKEDHPNYSMLEENLLAYFLYPRNTLFTALSSLIKKPRAPTPTNMEAIQSIISIPMQTS